MKKTVYIEELGKDIEIEFDIELDDVINYIDYEADSWDRQSIADEVESYVNQQEISQYDVEDYLETATMNEKKDFIDILLNRTSSNPYILEGTLEEEMKEEWWEAVRRKYTLEQLEEVLGNKFDLM